MDACGDDNKKETQNNELEKGQEAALKENPSVADGEGDTACVEVPEVNENENLLTNDLSDVYTPVTNKSNHNNNSGNTRSVFGLFQSASSRQPVTSVISHINQAPGQKRRLHQRSISREGDASCSKRTCNTDLAQQGSEVDQTQSSGTEKNEISENENCDEEDHDGEDDEGLDDLHNDTDAAAPSPTRKESVGTRRFIVSEQNRAYEESLRKDQEKQKRKDEERKAQLEREELRKAKAEVLKQIKTEARENLPTEPNAGEEGVFPVLLRLPSGQRVRRNFHTSDSTQTLYLFAVSQEDSPAVFSIINSSFILAGESNRIRSDSDGTLASYGITSPVVLIVHDETDEQDP